MLIALTYSLQISTSFENFQKPEIFTSDCFFKNVSKLRAKKKSLKRYLRLKRTRLHRLKHTSSPHAVNELFTCFLMFDVDLVFCDLSFTCS